ncbi:MAG: hypothetical protein OEL78_02745 [Hyphomicrobiales bacterium]|nr:hypothetical protein [Hyphomicrobiales bacterium]
MAKDPSSGRAAGSRQSKAGRKSVTIDLEAEEVGKGGTKTGPVAGTAKKPAQSASSEAGAPKAEPSKAASEPVKAGPLKAAAAKGQPDGGKAESDKAKVAEGPMKSGASGEASAKKAATASRQPDRKPAGPKSGPVRPAQSPAAPSTASRLIAAVVGGIIALGGAVALDRLQILSIFGADSGLSDLQTQITGVKQQTGGQIADLQTQIAALPAASGTEADGLAALGEKITQIEASLAEQGARLTKAEQPQALSDLEARLAALESAVQSGAAGPDAGLAAIEQKLAGVEETIAGVQGLAGEAAGNALAAVKPEIDRLGASTIELTRRVKTLEGGLSGLVDPQIVAALGMRVEQLAGVIDNNASPQTIEALKSALAAQSLAAAVAAGRPFAAELDILQSGTDGGADLTAIAPYAAEGLSDAAALATEFEALIPSLSPPEPEQPAAPESAGLVDRLLASARNVVEVRQAGPAAGGELMGQTGAILQALNGNNLKAALTAWQGLPVEARQASAGWAAKLEARLAADALAGSLRAEALSRLATVGGGEGQ